MDLPLGILLFVLLVFAGVIFLGRYAERHRRKNATAQLYNVPCPRCRTPFGDRNFQVVEKIIGQRVPGADVLPMAWRIQCKSCGHTLVCEDADRINSLK